jgi:CrcB protein
MNQLLLIATGGALGALARFFTISIASTLLGNNFPYGTLIANVLGSFAVGAISIFLLDKGGFSVQTQSFLIIGFLGAFTTFSTFSVETITLMQNAEWLKATGNILLNLTLCLLATFSGIYLVRGG